MSEPRYLCPDHNPPSNDDYRELYAQFIALILSTGKTSITVPHSIKHPLNPDSGVLVVRKQVDNHHTTFTVEPAP
jgi:hypothetical protein